MIFEVTAWKVTSRDFSGIVYTQEIALNHLSRGRSWRPVEIEMIKLYRDHEPLPHMTYRRVR
jgi:hypothetical protein